MVERIFPAAHIEGVAVGQKYLPAQFLDSAYDGLGIIRPQKARLPSSPKWILTATYLSVKSMSPMPAVRMRRFSLAGMFSVKDVLKLVKYTFDFSICSIGFSF